jgi:hypothetical protein
MKIDGNHILYHYLQKELFETDIWLFQMLSSRLVANLGIWFHPDYYQKIPILLPFVVRDPSCRRRKKDDIEAWGSPNEMGYLRDDNSLVKGLPKSLNITSGNHFFYSGKRIGKGFVASHVWRQFKESPTGIGLSSHNPILNTFIPNLVWLPTQVSKLTDREGTFTQIYLQALSAKIYRNLDVPDCLKSIVSRAWQMLNIPAGIPEQGLPDITELSFFEPSEKFFAERRKKINIVIDGLETSLRGRPLKRKIITSRYGEGLSIVPKIRLKERIHELKHYLEAIKAV